MGLKSTRRSPFSFTLVYTGHRHLNLANQHMKTTTREMVPCRFQVGILYLNNIKCINSVEVEILSLICLFENFDESYRFIVGHVSLHWCLQLETMGETNVFCMIIALPVHDNLSNQPKPQVLSFQLQVTFISINDH